MFDGTYLYAIQFEPSNLMGQYNTTASSTATSSYAFFDCSTITPTNAMQHFSSAGAAYDGRYVYTTPMTNGSPYMVARYDTTSTFTSASAWEKYDATGTFSVSNFSEPSQGAVFDGRYVYFVPFGNPSPFFIRYDTTTTFTSSGSWVRTPGASIAAQYYSGGTFDGRYVYFAPYTLNGTNGPAQTAQRYDTTAAFAGRRSSP